MYVYEQAQTRTFRSHRFIQTDCDRHLDTQAMLMGYHVATWDVVKFRWIAHIGGSSGLPDYHAQKRCFEHSHMTRPTRTITLHHDKIPDTCSLLYCFPVLHRTYSYQDACQFTHTSTLAYEHTCMPSICFTCLSTCLDASTRQPHCSLHYIQASACPRISLSCPPSYLPTQHLGAEIHTSKYTEIFLKHMYSVYIYKHMYMRIHGHIQM